MDEVAMLVVGSGSVGRGVEVGLRNPRIDAPIVMPSGIASERSRRIAIMR